MKLELLFIGFTLFIIYNTYYDGKYVKMLFAYKKYFQIGMIIFVSFSLYFMMKRNPEQGKNILLQANNMVKYMPIDRSAMDMISPIVDFTSNGAGFMNNMNNAINSGGAGGGENRILQSGGKGNKRSVSETKKKYVASSQNWKCGKCNQQLTAWFEVDHKVRLEHGGGNDVQNLIALCRECHGEKTAMENM